MDYRLPLLAYFEVTDMCNLRCGHCYNKESLGNGCRDLEDDQLVAIFTKLVQEGIFDIVITGGEPLIREKLLAKIINGYDPRQTSVTVNTNLLLLKDRMLPLLQRTDGMLISCAAVDPEIYKKMTAGGDYSLFERNYRKVIEHNIGNIVNMVVNRQNFNQIKAVALRIAELGGTSFSATPMLYSFDSPALKEELLSVKELHLLFDELEWITANTSLIVDLKACIPKCAVPAHVLEKAYSFVFRSCQAARRSVAVSSSGEVRPCANNPRSYGSVWKNRLRLFMLK
ncbi:MAG: radical SAM protein [Oligoflexia bacterium]|nr:radical SAM protein [Oligoflexia bacterium]